MRVGAIVGSLGAAFQIRDDILNLVGEEELCLKEINGDLYEGSAR
jgi:geranylgeranyl diphosphate synthase type II